MNPVTCVLYETSHCHLCEQAQQVLLPFVQRSACTVELVDIAEGDELLEQYGTRIPVLSHPASGHELNWPFDEPAVQRFLRQCLDSSS